MANCLMQINQCGFPNCGQHFANQYDLTAHIEYTHIPMIEEEVKRKAQMAAANSAAGDTPPLPVTNNLPLSYYSRVFRTAYRPNPIKPEPMKVSFNHYKRRALREKALHPHHMIHKVYRDMMASRGRNISLEEVEKRLGDVDFEECGPDNNEVRFRCHIVDCNKRYKNMFALRMHMKMSHSVVISEDAKSLTNFPSEDVKPPLLSLHPQQVQQGSAPPDSSNGTQSTGVATNPAATSQAQGLPPLVNGPQFGNPATAPTSYKCTYCTKRYKTSSGLSNHMMASHQKISDAQDAPSPQVVEQLISQVRMQRQQQEANSLEQKNGQAHQLPNVRSYTVTTTPQPLRYNQQHYPVDLNNQPSTGQVLQMHMQQQRRMKQMQEQQAAAAAAAAAQQQQQQPQQMQPTQGYAPSAQPGQSGSPMGPPMQQQQPAQQQSQLPPNGGAPQQQLQQQQQQAQSLPQQPAQQQYLPMPPQNASYQQQMHHQQMQNQHHYQQNAQYPQQSPQFPQYQQQSPQGPPPQGPPQRSPIPLSQALPPLNSMTQQRTPLPPIQPPNTVPMHLSPPNQQGYNMMTSPPGPPQMAPPPPPYNL